MGSTGAGSLFALGLRLTKLDAAGNPLAGEENCYVTDSVVRINPGLAYSEPDAIELQNGRGQTCLYFQPPPTVLSGTIEEFRVCTPDPIILNYLIGAAMIITGSGPTEKHVGAQAPAVNVDPTPNGVAIEAWSHAVRNNSYDPDLPYYHWVLPRARLRMSEAMTLGAEDPTTPQMEGTSEENPSFGTGPLGDIDFPTNRVWQYCQVATIPDLTPGFVVVAAES